LLAGYAALDKAFEAQHPGVTVKFVVKNFNDLVNTLKLQLSGSTVPDLTQVNEGYGSMGELVTDSLLANLDSYASQYHWSSRQSPTLLAVDGRFSTNGKLMGTGPLWGVAATGAWVGLWEDTAVAKSLGITSPPGTFGQLEKDLAIAAAHHVVPLQYGSTDGGESSWILATLLAAENSPQLVLNIVDAKPGASLVSPQVLKVADTLKAWSDDGYLTPGWAAYNNGDVFSKFIGGQGLFDLNGSWEVPLPNNVDAAKFALVPFPMAAGAPPAGIATGDIAWSIPTKAAHKVLAAQYLDFITSPNAAKIWIANGQVPATTPPNLSAAMAGQHLATPSVGALTGWQAILTKGVPVPYMDWATPTFYNTIEATVEELLGNKISPAAFTERLQADYGPFAKSLR
jgi:raffinose/stachyose/melibiose transport system substrate-binding protein